MNLLFVLREYEILRCNIILEWFCILVLFVKVLIFVCDIVGVNKMKVLKFNKIRFKNKIDCKLFN